MGIFDFFKKDQSSSSALGKHPTRVASKRVQAIDRWESIQELIKIGTPQAIEALLQRFTFYIEPSITDQEEKDAAFAGIVEAGETSIEPVCRFLRTSESISWPVKILDRIATPEFVIGILIEILNEMDTEYERDPQRKIQILATFEERTDPRIVESIVRFLEDANETVRFNTVGALLVQKEANSVQEQLIDTLCDEESVRVKNRILQGFGNANWSVEHRKDDVRNSLTAGYTLDSKGIPRKTK